MELTVDQIKMKAIILIDLLYSIRMYAKLNGNNYYKLKGTLCLNLSVSLLVKISLQILLTVMADDLQDRKDDQTVI